LREGDKCTEFFHRVANLNRRIYSIESLLVNGLVTWDQFEIREHIVHFYNILFTDQEEAIWLERPFEESEVLEVVKGMNRDKVLDPDGFTMAIFQTCWDVIKEDVMMVFHEFHASSKFEKNPQYYFRCAHFEETRGC
jgi:hypothetical protein